MRQTDGRRYGFGADDQVKDRGASRRDCTIEGSGEVLRPFDTLAMPAECSCIGGEIGILQIGRRQSTRIVTLLMQIWVQSFLRYRSFAWHLAPTSGSMGYGLLAPVGDERLWPGRTVNCFAGDGCFLMNG